MDMKTARDMIDSVEVLDDPDMEEAHELACVALDLQVPKKPVLKLHENRVPGDQEEYYCPTCDEWLSWSCQPTFKYCYECGQKLDRLEVH